jgi:APA family basic amino acid/polyamine antiporter
MALGLFLNLNKLFMKSFLRIRTIESILSGAKKNSLTKSMGAMDLVLFGIGCTIGTGIFVLTGIAAAEHAGPAIALSYLLAALVCIFTGLAYTELAAALPVSGSCYTYSYAIFGEFTAWMIACALMLEYMIGAATVSAGWSGYFVGILKSGGINIPEMLTKSPADGGVINLPAMGIALFIGILLMRGTKTSMMLNRILVAVKLIIIFLFLFIAAPHIQMENYANFMPFGWQGVAVGSAAIFYAYVGFDSVSTAAEEAKNPNRDLPIGIIGSLVICATLYILVALALTGIVPYTSLNNAAPMSNALTQNGSNLGSALIGVGAIAGMVAVLLVLMYAQSRILFVMSRDGLLPAYFSKLHKKYDTPFISCAIVTVVVALITGFIPLKTLSYMTSFGTLLTFIAAAIGVMILRVRRPKLDRPFKCPALFVVAPIAVITCGYLTYKLLLVVVEPVIIWAGLSAFVYFAYSYRKSPLAKKGK